MKKIISISILTILILFSFYTIYFLIVVLPKEKQTKCGIIESKAQQNSGGKYGYTELYLNVRWKDGTGESMKVGNNAYYFHKKGDQICFEDEENKPVLVFICQMLGVAFTLIYGGLAIYYLFRGIYLILNWCIKNI